MVFLVLHGDSSWCGKCLHFLGAYLAPKPWKLMVIMQGLSGDRKEAPAAFTL